MDVNNQGMIINIYYVLGICIGIVMWYRLTLDRLDVVNLSVIWFLSRSIFYGNINPLQW